jgi:hypothetical protein
MASLKHGSCENIRPEVSQDTLTYSARRQRRRQLLQTCPHRASEEKGHKSQNRVPPHLKGVIFVKIKGVTTTYEKKKSKGVKAIRATEGIVG